MTTAQDRHTDAMGEAVADAKSAHAAAMQETGVTDEARRSMASEASRAAAFAALEASGYTGETRDILAALAHLEATIDRESARRF